MKLILFFIALSAWCAGCFDTPSPWPFEIPSTWCCRYSTRKVMRAPTVMPEGLSEFNVIYRSRGIILSLRSPHYTVCCCIEDALVFSADNIFKIDIRHPDSAFFYRGSVLSSMRSNDEGSVLLLTPQKQDPIVHTFSTGAGSETPPYFCECLAGVERFTVNRFLQQYQDGAKFFVGVTFKYSDLTDVKVACGTQRTREDGSVYTEARPVSFDFASCLQGKCQ